MQKSSKLTYSLTNTTLRTDRARVSALSTLSLFTLWSNNSLGTWWTLESKKKKKEKTQNSTRNI